MSRTSGARNRNYKEKQMLMVDSSLDYSLDLYPESVSMRAFASKAQVSLTNFRHYFPSENDLRIAAISRLAQRQEKRTRHYLKFANQSPRNGLCGLIRQFVSDWRSGLGREVALARHYASFGSAENSLGDKVLKPYLESVGQCMALYMKRRQMRKGDTRQAALMLLSPAVVVFMIEGDDVQKDIWIEKQVGAFLKGWW